MKSFKCPSCGDNVIFSCESNLIHCPSCGNDFEERDIIEQNSSNTNVCPGCGAPYDNPYGDLSGFCESCGTSLVSDEIINTIKTPDLIAAFQIDTKEAERRFKEWLRERVWTPRELKEQFRLTAQNQVLVPFWCFNYDNSGEMVFRTTKVTTHYTSKYTITDTYTYRVRVNGESKYDMIPNDAMEAMEDEYLDAISPFSNKKLAEFTLPKLSNTTALQYDYTDEDLKSRSLSKVREFTKELYIKAMPAYTTVTLETDKVRYTNTRVNLVYYPLYSFSYNHNGKEYNFYMNAQSGKISGDTPLAAGNMVLSIACTSILSFIFLVAVSIVLALVGFPSTLITLIVALLMGVVPAICFNLQAHRRN